MSETMKELYLRVTFFMQRNKYINLDLIYFGRATILSRRPCWQHLAWPCKTVTMSCLVTPRPWKSLKGPGNSWSEDFETSVSLGGLQGLEALNALAFHYKRLSLISSSGSSMACLQGKIGRKLNWKVGWKTSIWFAWNVCCW